MVSKDHRFQGASSLKFVHARGTVTRGPQFSVKSIVNNRRQTYRVAIVVSKKVSKSAVVRNRIRRRLYELVRKYEAGITQPFDILVLVYSDAIATAPSSKLEQQFLVQFKKAKIL